LAAKASGLAGLAVFVAEEAAVIARVEHRLGAKPLVDGEGLRLAIWPSDSSPAATTTCVDADRRASKSGS
jgi:hypothetical protein